MNMIKSALCISVVMAAVAAQAEASPVANNSASIGVSATVPTMCTLDAAFSKATLVLLGTAPVTSATINATCNSAYNVQFSSNYAVDTSGNVNLKGLASGNNYTLPVIYAVTASGTGATNGNKGSGDFFNKPVTEGSLNAVTKTTYQLSANVNTALSSAIPADVYTDTVTINLTY